LDPKLIVADESVSALDVSAQAQVLNLLNDIQKRLNSALVFITHDLRVAMQVCDAVAVMQKGATVEYCKPSQIFDNPQPLYTHRPMSAVPGKYWKPEESCTAVNQAMDYTAPANI